MVAFPKGATNNVDAATAASRHYDAVIVGAGITGAIVANELAQKHKRVLLLEAGVGEDRTLEGYESLLQRFYATAVKDNQSPFAVNAAAPFPRGDVRKMIPGQADTSDPASRGHLLPQAGEGSAPL